MSENIHEICGNKKIHEYRRKTKKRKKTSEHTYDEMEKINQKNGKQLIN